MAKNGFVVRRAPLTPRQIQMMLSVLIRHEKAFMAARNRLKPEHFNEYELGYAVVWQLVLTHYTEFNRLPDQGWLLGAIEQRLSEDPEALSDEEIEELDYCIKQAFEVTYDDIRPEVATGWMARFLEDRLTVKTQEYFRSGRNTPTNLAALLQELSEEAVSIQTIQTNSLECPFPDNWIPKSIGKVPTNVPFIDHFLNGGHAPKEVYGLLGPYGSCKTTLMVQLSIQGARYQYEQWRKGGEKGPQPNWYYFSYEEAVDSAILLRALSHCSMIPRTTLEDFKDMSDLSTATNLKDYERELFKDIITHGGKVMGEQERFRFYQRVLNRNWRAVDMSGNDKDNRLRGAGLAPEIAAIINHDRETRDITVAGICVDYVGAACEKYIERKGQDHKELRHLVGKFPLHAKQLANQLDCPVWLAHQLSGEANSRTSGHVQHHTSAAEAKNFAENLDFCFTVGTKTLEELCVFAQTKGRRTGSKREVVIKIDGHLSTVRQPDRAYMVDATSRRIVPAQDYYTVADEEEESNYTRPPRAATRAIQNIGGL